VGAGEIQLIAEQVNEQGTGFNRDCAGRTVDGKGDILIHLPVLRGRDGEYMGKNPIPPMGRTEDLGLRTQDQEAKKWELRLAECYFVLSPES
jgi:hypothetical protein